MELRTERTLSLALLGNHFMLNPSIQGELLADFFKILSLISRSLEALKVALV
jgi:hypothetical protein